MRTFNRPYDFSRLPDCIEDGQGPPVELVEPSGIPRCGTCGNDPDSCGCTQNERWDDK